MKKKKLLGALALAAIGTAGATATYLQTQEVTTQTADTAPTSQGMPAPQPLPMTTTVGSQAPSQESQEAAARAVIFGNTSDSATSLVPGEDPGTTIIGFIISNIVSGLLSIPVIPDVIIEAFELRETAIPEPRDMSSLTQRNTSVPIRLRSDTVGGDIIADEIDPLLIYEIAERPKHGTLSGTPPYVTYTPNPGYTGFDRFKFSVRSVIQAIPLTLPAQVDVKVQGSYNAFESGQVRPLALNSDKTRLYAVNTPDNRLEIFDVTQAAPRLLKSVPVGMEPVAVSLRNDGEAWVVNTLSDSVSVVDVGAPVPYVKRTLLVGDEPQDVVFAGPNKRRAFVTTAHRGQNSPSDMAALTPGIGRADVWVYDAPSVDQQQNDAAPLKILTLFGMPARGLAVSPDGGTVYAAIYKSGNQTTVIGPNTLLLGPNSTKFGKPGLKTDASGLFGNLDGKWAPNTGVIVQFNGTDWVDSYGTKWNDYVNFKLPDKDVFAIDANAADPVVKTDFAHVGTSLFNIAVNPVSGALYVSNLEAKNLNRFEGDDRTDGKLSVNGRFIQNRITVIKNGQVLPRNLNKHLVDAITYGNPGDNERSLAMPLQMQVDSQGRTLYLAAYGSSKIGVFNTDQLEADSFTPSTLSQITVSGGGPAGMVLDEARGRMYVLTRFNNSIAVVNTVARAETASVPMYNPEPDFVVKGRPFLYDARFSSAKGDSSCSSCHLFGDNDGLAWDLGNPKEKWALNPRKYVTSIASTLAQRANHPLKGPMTTQSFRGLEFNGPQHWRGDRTGATRVAGESRERAAFKLFAPAFVSLVGRTSEPTQEQMGSFADFIMQLRYPPNPIRNLDDTLTPDEVVGKNVFYNKLTTGFRALRDEFGISNATMTTCNECHELHPQQQRFGSATKMSFEGLPQDMKVAHFRNLYQKVGMFGMSSMLGTYGDKNAPQVSGFGFMHDGAMDTTEHFIGAARTGQQGFVVPPAELPGLLKFIMAEDNGLAPAVGQQFTLNQLSAGAVSRVDLLVDRALAHTRPGAEKVKRCELIANGLIYGKSYSFLLQDNGEFATSDSGIPTFSESGLRSLAVEPGNSVTYTCVPPGAGTRMALDRDEDGIPDGVDAVTSGVAYTSIQPSNPNAPVETDRMETALEHNYLLEAVQAVLLQWPTFTTF
ncbi:beta-propeller fold lactonase family protein [Luteimonas panaciterrae]|uniref:beta-propeller fold lactonase family protein n=1 Tax=Luteimonas panaciterrae TaxID=363885 RepID=UPI001CFC21BA|nr:beta-propeller fold lactonase family protein [Luteimonas panaciterrae]